MVPVDGPPAGFRIFPLPSPGDLAAALGLRHEELAWFADEQRMNARAASTRSCRTTTTAGSPRRAADGGCSRRRSRG